MATGFGLSATLKSTNSHEVTQPNQFIDKFSQLAEKNKQMGKRNLKLEVSLQNNQQRNLILKNENCLEEFREAEVSAKEWSVFTTASSCTHSTSDSWNARSL